MWELFLKIYAWIICGIYCLMVKVMLFLKILVDGGGQTIKLKLRLRWFGECKWTNKKKDVDTLDTLIGKSLNFTFDKYYYIFSKSGFTNALNDKADKMGNVCLISYNDML